MKEALEVLKQVTKNTHLENQVILLSTNYEENVKTANAGSESPAFILEKRAQILNGLLNILKPYRINCISKPKNALYRTIF